MARRHPNPRLAKIHRSYTVEEIASLYGLHRNTVREWIKRGLPVCDDRRPQLVLGRDLAKFLETRRTRNRHIVKRGEASVNSDFAKGTADHANAQPEQ